MPTQAGITPDHHQTKKPTRSAARRTAVNAAAASRDLSVGAFLSSAHLSWEASRSCDWPASPRTLHVRTPLGVGGNRSRAPRFIRVPEWLLAEAPARAPSTGAGETGSGRMVATPWCRRDLGYGAADRGPPRFTGGSGPPGSPQDLLNPAKAWFNHRLEPLTLRATDEVASP